MAPRKKVTKPRARAAKKAAPPPRGADEIKEALVAAVVRLLDRRGAADISVKEVAAEARVNHGLVHRHFGSKEALVREAVIRANARIREGHPDVGALSWSTALHRARPELARILARCCLDGPMDLLALAGPDPAKVDTHARQVEGILSRVGMAGLVDPYLLNALGVAASLGWVVFRPYLEAGYKIPKDADAQIAALTPLVDLALAGGGLLGDLGGAPPPAGA